MESIHIKIALFLRGGRAQHPSFVDRATSELNKLH